MYSFVKCQQTIILYNNIIQKTPLYPIRVIERKKKGNVYRKFEIDMSNGMTYVGDGG